MYFLKDSSIKKRLYEGLAGIILNKDKNITGTYVPCYEIRLQVKETYTEEELLNFISSIHNHIMEYKRDLVQQNKGEPIYFMRNRTGIIYGPRKTEKDIFHVNFIMNYRYLS